MEGGGLHRPRSRGVPPGILAPLGVFSAHQPKRHQPASPLASRRSRAPRVEGTPSLHASGLIRLMQSHRPWPADG